MDGKLPLNINFPIINSMAMELMKFNNIMCPELKLNS
jgi:hypothetical protein